MDMDAENLCQWYRGSYEPISFNLDRYCVHLRRLINQQRFTDDEKKMGSFIPFIDCLVVSAVTLIFYGCNQTKNVQAFFLMKYALSDKKRCGYDNIHLPFQIFYNKLTRVNNLLLQIDCSDLPPVQSQIDIVCAHMNMVDEGKAICERRFALNKRRFIVCHRMIEAFEMEYGKQERYTRILDEITKRFFEELEGVTYEE